MERLTQQEVSQLLELRGKGLEVSLYMPTLRGREGSRENPIRFKNLLKKVDSELESNGLKYAQRQEILEPAYNLIDESFFWSSQSEGLAYFLSPGFSRLYRLPIKFEERAIVKNSFYLKPLFYLLAADRQFYVLALSQKNARLLRGTRGMVEEMDLGDIIDKFQEKFGGELPEQSLQFHTRAPQIGGTRPAIFYGGGVDLDKIQREKLRKYFRFIDQELHQVMDEKNVPLVLACVEELAPLYREASNSPMLMEQQIKGNPDNMKAEEIHRQAMEIMEPYFKKQLDDVKKKYLDLKGTGKTSNNLREILPSSFQGRINDLFVDPKAQQWGWYYQDLEDINWQEESLPENEELYDLVATETYVHNGNVYALPPEDLPDSEPVSAVFRW